MDVCELSIETKLRSDFSALAKNLGANEATVKAWNDALISHYTEPQRYYHTIEHINSMLVCRDRYRHLIRDDTSVGLAIFFHDWIYNPEDKNNELESIKCFEEFATDMKLSDAIIIRVSEYIERTITHTIPMRNSKPDSDMSLFLDFDLEVLSRNSTDYSLYAGQIRQEYRCLSETDYCTGRIKVLKAFLGRERLYFSDSFYEMHEEIARRNLRGEIEILERKLEESRGAL